MAEQKKDEGKPLTPREQEIKRLVDKGRDKRTEQEDARLDQLKMEERRFRFERLAKRRVEKALKALTSVAMMANNKVYEYTDHEAQRICERLRRKLDTLEDAFSGRSEESDEFNL